MYPYAIINDRICDNYEYCPARMYCKKGHAAIKYNIDGDGNGIISIDKEKCVGCGECISFCGLFRVVDNPMVERKERREFAQNPLTSEDYQTTERFGCDAFNDACLLNKIEEIDAYIGSAPTNGYNILEFVDAANELCPFQGIAVKDVLSAFPDKLNEYRKYIVELGEVDLIRHKYGLDDLPAIIFLRNSSIAKTPVYGKYRVDSINGTNNEFQVLDILKEEFILKLEE